jgi:uncharacterized protein YkwD
MTSGEVVVRHPRRRRRASVAAALFALAGGLPTTARAQAAAEPEWLTVTNLYRASAGVNPITENLEASAGARAHSSYLVTNKASGHDEYPNRPGFSRPGLRAGQTGDVYIASGGVLTPRQLIEGWMGAPFHGLAILNPEITSFGFGVAGGKKYFAATLPIGWDKYTEPTEEELAALVEPDFDGAFRLVEKKFPGATRGNCEASSNGEGTRIVITCGKRRFLVEGTNVRELKPDEIAPPMLSVAAEGKFPTIVWPGAGSSVPMFRYTGNENPDPLSGCPGLKGPTGLPILVARDRETEFSAVTVTETGGAPQQVCVLTAETFASNDSVNTEVVRNLLGNSAIIIPKAPLKPGASYDVSLTFTDGEVKQWQFSTSTDGQVHLPAENPMANVRTPGIPFQPLKATSGKAPKTPAKKSPAPKKTK